MPEHGLHAIFGVLKIDAVMVEMAPDFSWAQVAIKELKNWKGVEKLLFGLINQVTAVGIKNLPITLQHPHHFQDMVGGFRKQGLASQQAAFQFRCRRHVAPEGEIGRNDWHQPRLPTVVADTNAGNWAMAVVVASLQWPRSAGNRPRASTPRARARAGRVSRGATGTS